MLRRFGKSLRSIASDQILPYLITFCRVYRTNRGGLVQLWMKVSSSQGFKILGWNIGGADPHQLSKAVVDGSGSHIRKNDLVLLQELPRASEGWTYMQFSGRRLVGHREGSQWRGTGLWYDERAWCVLRKLGTRKGTWFKLRHLECSFEVWLGTAHFTPGCPVQQYEEEAANHFGGLPKTAHRVVFQGDVNTGFTWQADEGVVTAVAKEGKGGILHQTCLEHSLQILPPGQAATGGQRRPMHRHLCGEVCAP